MAHSPTRLTSAGRPWRVGTIAVTVIAVACASASNSRQRGTIGRASNGDITPSPRAPGSSPRDASLRQVRVALSPRAMQVTISSPGEWSLYGSDGSTVLGVPRPHETWILEADGHQVSARREDSRPVSQRDNPIVVRPSGERGTISFNGRLWRGELAISAAEGGLLVVNRVRMDDYIKGVVPLEIGTSAGADAAAVAAQAVTARSYAYMHLMGPSRPYDMVATVQDQVYGGASAETSTGNLAVDATVGLVLLYNGRVVNAPYHANCGGSTAEPGDAWRSGPEPHLRRVSDEVPGTRRFYCDWAPRYRWTKSYTGEELRQSIARYVRGLSGGVDAIGAVRAVAVTDVTPAGRVATLSVETDRGRWALRGNEVRAALRTASGELLYSTYFALDARSGRDGVQSLILRGGGNGHGVGMCQAGAIGRARAGQDFRTILRTYYPGTTVGPVE